MEVKTITHSLKEYFHALAQVKNTKNLESNLLYRSLKPQIDEVLSSYEYAAYASTPPYEKMPFVRAVSWNIERGINYDGVLEVLKNHPDISKAHLLYLIETDVGMARTQNRNVARELAKALGMNYVFIPAYLSLTQGNSLERHLEGKNQEALHGNAFLTRFPISNFRIVTLKNSKDIMRGFEKRIGSQQALICDVEFPFKKITTILVHLDAHSSQRQRASQMQTILSAIPEQRYPVLLGGDLNTSSSNARNAVCAFLSFLNKVFNGASNILKNHCPYPYRRFDKQVFEVIKKQGFDYESFNQLGVGTLHYRVEDMRGNNLIQEVVPSWCRKLMEAILKRNGGKVSLKLDWFAGKWLKTAYPTIPQALPPTVFPDLQYQGKMISDHDPILVDVDIYQ